MSKAPKVAGKTVTLSSVMRARELPRDAATLRQHAETGKIIQLSRVRNGYSRQKWPSEVYPDEGDKAGYYHRGYLSCSTCPRGFICCVFSFHSKSDPLLAV